MYLLRIAKARKRNPRLVPKKVTVERGGKTFQTTVWVLPDQAEATGAQLDIFASAEVEDQLAAIQEKRPEPQPPERDPEKIEQAVQRVTPDTRNETQAQLFGFDPEETAEDEPDDYLFEPEPLGDRLTPLVTQSEPAFDYSHAIPKKMLLQPQDGILDRERPAYIPDLEEDELRYNRGFPPIADNGDGTYFIVSARRGDIKQYKLSLDGLAATLDYYWKRFKEGDRREIAARQEAMREKSEVWLAEHPERDAFQESRYSRNERDYHQRVVAGKVKPRVRKFRVLGKNKMTYSQQYVERASGYKNRAMWDHYRELRESIDRKMKDMAIQTQDVESTYHKGEETSFGDAGTVADLLDSHGVLVKRQNGDDITPEEVGQIRKALDGVFDTYGDRSEMARKYGLKVSHTGKTLVHARRAQGLFFPTYRAIAVSSHGGDDQFGFTLSHEWAHFMDSYLGGTDRWYASDDTQSQAGKIAARFREHMSRPQKSDYQSRTCECFARAFEQYFATKQGKGEQYQREFNREGNHPDQATFKRYIAPMIDEFFETMDPMLKSLWDHPMVAAVPIQKARKIQGRVDFQGLPISVENRKGAVRSGVDPDGSEWRTKMEYPYGYIRLTEGTDGDHVDCYVGPNRESRNVYVVHQVEPTTGRYDEDKVMLGFDSAAQAKRAYLKHYDDPRFFGSMDEMDIDQFKERVYQSKGGKVAPVIPMEIPS